MNNRYNYLLCISFLAIGAAIYYYRVPSASPSRIQIACANSFCLPKECKHLALLGCTPHPTNYLKGLTKPLEALSSIQLKDVVDIEDLKDSFARTFAVCATHTVDHLLIAYLPIYYVGLKQLLKNNFVPGCRMFLNRIHSDIETIINETKTTSNYAGAVTLLFPLDEELKHVPNEAPTPDARIRYLIKQFPKLTNITASALHTITIINNQGSQEDGMLINYLNYEYLYEKPITYITRSTNKTRFHKEPNNKNFNL